MEVYLRAIVKMVLDSSKTQQEVIVNENFAIGKNSNATSTYSRIDIYIDIIFVIIVLALAYIVIRKIIVAHKNYVNKRIASAGRIIQPV